MADQTLTWDEFCLLRNEWRAEGRWRGAVLEAVTCDCTPGKMTVAVTFVGGRQEIYLVLREDELPAKRPVTKWTLTTDPLMVRRMGKTGEECSELVAVTTRIGIQGIDEIDPGTGKTNRLRLIEEIGDVYAQLDANLEMLGLDREFIEARRARKLGYMREWEALYVTKPGDTFLCRAWGETELPCVRIARSREEVRQFYIEEWLGDEDATGYDGTPTLPGLMEEFDSHDWDDESEISIEFEIGGVSVERVFG